MAHAVNKGLFVYDFLRQRLNKRRTYYARVITLRASCGAVYCNRPCLFVCVWVGGSVTTITRNCAHRSSPNWILGKGSDHLQLIKFWPSRAPVKGVCGGAKFFGSALLQPARSVCVSSERFFINYLQLLPLYVMDEMYYPGVPGLFTACIFSGALR